MNKNKEILKFSNPEIVFEKANYIYGPDNIKIQISNRKDKKYMIYFNNSQKWVHFGQMFYEDYTKHNDELRRNKFLIRNRRFKDASIYSPAFLSYYLLWI